MLLKLLAWWGTEGLKGKVSPLLLRPWLLQNKPTLLV